MLNRDFEKINSFVCFEPTYALRFISTRNTSTYVCEMDFFWMQFSTVWWREHLKIDFLKPFHERTFRLWTYFKLQKCSLNNTQKNSIHGICSPSTQLSGCSCVKTRAQHSQFHSITLQFDVQWSFQLYQSNIVYILIRWRKIFMPYKL